MWFDRSGIVLLTGLLLLAANMALAGCSKSSKPSATEFATPDDAANAIIAAAKSGDRTAAAIFVLTRFGNPFTVGNQNQSNFRYLSGVVFRF